MRGRTIHLPLQGSFDHIIGSPLFTLIIFMTRGQGRIDVYGTGKGIKNPNIKECSLMSVPKPSGSNISSGLILSICCGIGKDSPNSFCSGGSIMTSLHTTVSRWGCGISEFIVTDCNESTRRTVKRMFHCKGSPTSTIREKYRWRCRWSHKASWNASLCKEKLWADKEVLSTKLILPSHLQHPGNTLYVCILERWKKMLSLWGQNYEWCLSFTIFFLLETFRRTGIMVSDKRWTINLVRGNVIITDDWYCMPAMAKGLMLPIPPSLAGNEINEQKLLSKASWPVKAGNNQRRMEPSNGWRWCTSLGVVQ